MAYKAEDKVESRSEHRKLKNKEDGFINKRYFSLILSIAGVLIIGATAVFYVYPKIMNDGNIPPKNAYTETVANKDVKKVSNSEKKTETKSKEVAKETTTKEAKATDAEKQSKDYLLPDSNSRKLTNADLIKLNPNDLRIARNEIYARHGLVFKSSDLTIYFTSKSWYKPNPAYGGELNDVEKYNINLIKSKE
ncbi:YARHG domain-containing protein [Gottfriedia acidiceleris]|uniref:YARHG domain-containing protein n=1 Tax=Gottfriedia acidiceleris TaxID=371036 RepID=UPI001F375D1C|nr:YARHG domain-containing protein [Gottfriedia acidiceleris]